MGERQLLRHFNRRIEILTATINELSEAVRDLQTYMDTEVESMEELMEAHSLLFEVLEERIHFSKELALYKGLRYILLNDEI
jgi:chorismate mutase